MCWRCDGWWVFVCVCVRMLRVGIRVGRARRLVGGDVVDWVSNASSEL